MTSYGIPNGLRRELFLKLFCGDNIKILKDLENNSVDSIVTDPPYGLSFMNKKWDHSVPSVEFWKECLRVLKPGGHVLSFGGTRTYHRMAVNIEDAGFEIRDQIMWLYGSGFPKSQNVSKMIDKKFGLKGESIGPNPNNRPNSMKGKDSEIGSIDYKVYQYDDLRKTASDQAKQWDGFGTALKPANEPIVLARKPLSEKTIVDNVLKYGTGALNIDGCRVEYSSESDLETTKAANQRFIKSNNENSTGGWKQTSEIKFANDESKGRWPANVILDEVAGEMLDEQSGTLKSHGGGKATYGGSFGNGKEVTDKTAMQRFAGDSGGASRFFYCAKASKKERNAGLDSLPLVKSGSLGTGEGGGPMLTGSGNERTNLNQNFHPTVKPIKLMEYLIKLITPPNGVVLDPFMGSGSTGVAAKNLGFDFVGMELDKEYFEIAKKRVGQCL